MGFWEVGNLRVCEFMRFGIWRLASLRVCVFGSLGVLEFRGFLGVWEFRGLGIWETRRLGICNSYLISLVVSNPSCLPNQSLTQAFTTSTGPLRRSSMARTATALP